MIIEGQVEGAFSRDPSIIIKGEKPIGYVYAHNQLVARIDASSTPNDIHYYHNDRIGSPRAITNSTGDIIWKTDYRPFGSAMNEEGEGDFKFGTKNQDDTGMYYFDARYYDAELGRFTSTAPVMDSNLYVFGL